MQGRVEDRLWAAAAHVAGCQRDRTATVALGVQPRAQAGVLASERCPASDPRAPEASCYAEVTSVRGKTALPEDDLTTEGAQLAYAPVLEPAGRTDQGSGTSLQRRSQEAIRWAAGEVMAQTYRSLRASQPDLQAGRSPPCRPS